MARLDKQLCRGEPGDWAKGKTDVCHRITADTAEGPVHREQQRLMHLIPGR